MFDLVESVETTILGRVDDMHGSSSVSMGLVGRNMHEAPTLFDESPTKTRVLISEFEHLNAPNALID